MTRVAPSPTPPDESGPAIPELIGSSKAMQEVYRQVRQVAHSNAPVLLVGEKGTEKRLVAQSIHRLSRRRGGLFVSVECGAWDEDRLESELFGHVRGGLAGTTRHRIGRFESAAGGTLFLDEVDCLTPRLQVKLLGALRDRRFEPMGDTVSVRAEARVIAASSLDLLEEITAGRFCEELYYRLGVVAIPLPALRARREDIPALADYFLAVYSAENDSHVHRIQPAALEALRAYAWPGNVAELRSCIERAVVLATGNASALPAGVERAVVLAAGEEITCDLLPEAIRGGKPRRVGLVRGADIETLAAELVQQGIEAAGEEADDLYERIVSRVERALLAQVMADCQKVQTKAADRLGINRNTLHKKLKEHKLEK
jgi:DNA-binding NtrC family response regulator